jgi:erythromycin esterase-like protein
VDEKNVHQLTPANHRSTASDVTPFDNTSLSNLPFMDKKILAIGETIHGTEEFNSMAIDIIKKRIMQHNCRLVLLELPLEFSFYINRYIDGDPNFKLEYIFHYFENTLFSTSAFISLIEWIKKFNQYSSAKVYFFGMDVWPIEMKRYLDLFDFFYTLNEAANNDEIQKICRMLLRNRSSIDEVISLFDTNDGFKNILTENESKLIRRSMMLLGSIRSTIEHRDRTMFENIELIMSDLVKDDETVIIFSHFGHSNYQNIGGRMTYREWTLSFGYYLNNKYKDNYSCIALVAKEGSFFTSKSNFFDVTVEQLHPAPHGSLEYLINRLNIDTGYVSMEKFTCADALKVRAIGNAPPKEQFGFIVPKRRMDGAIFIKNVSAIQKSEEVMSREVHPNLVLMERHRQALVKMGVGTPSDTPFY